MGPSYQHSQTVKFFLAHSVLYCHYCTNHRIMFLLCALIRVERTHFLNSPAWRVLLDNKQHMEIFFVSLFHLVLSEVLYSLLAIASRA